MVQDATSTSTRVLGELLRRPGLSLLKNTSGTAHGLSDLRLEVQSAADYLTMKRHEDIASKQKLL